MAHLPSPSRNPRFWLSLALLLGLAACGVRPAALTPTPWVTPSPRPTPAASPTAPDPARVTASPLPTGRPLTLTPAGEPRTLPDRILGASAYTLYDNFIADPPKAEAVRLIAPAVLRFPGGTIANYYNWRTGLTSVEARPDSSAYTKFWADLAPRLARSMPKGAHMEQYAPFAAGLGADIILVPNLETSSAEEQVNWFRALARQKILPRDIELGNEFALAMAGDPNVVDKFRDQPDTMVILKRFEEVLRPVLGKDGKFAVQSAASAFNILSEDTRPFRRRLLAWDQALAPAPWFEAVTAHLYPEPDAIAAQSSSQKPDDLFALFMGRADQGVDRAVDDLIRRLPGKEIWITEWNPRGGAAPDSTRIDKVSPGMAAHLAARTTLALLRHPEVTKSVYHMLFFGSDSPYQSFVREGSTWTPLPAALVVGWFNQAANGGSSFQRLSDTSDPLISGLGVFAESYRPVEAGLFRSPKRTTLIIQNASAQARTFDPAGSGLQSKPTRVEVLTVAGFASPEKIAARPASPDPALPVVLPPYSLARLVWE